MEEIIGRGAEAILYKEKVYGEPALVKDRIKKGYRIKELDIKLRKQRTKREADLLSEARRIGVKTPAVLKTKETKLFLELIEGRLVRELIPELDRKELGKLMKTLGKKVGKLHVNDIVHGDLTTSNMIKKEDGLYFIDFGLGFVSSSVEDKAVDLHVLKEALKSRHNEVWKTCFSAFKKGYKKVDEKEAKEVLKRLKVVEKRGRYK